MRCTLSPWCAASLGRVTPARAPATIAAFRAVSELSSGSGIGGYLQVSEQ